MWIYERLGADIRVNQIFDLGERVEGRCTGNASMRSSQGSKFKLTPRPFLGTGSNSLGGVSKALSHLGVLLEIPSPSLSMLALQLFPPYLPESHRGDDQQQTDGSR
jgi:hypothetical protein